MFPFVIKEVYDLLRGNDMPNDPGDRTPRGQIKVGSITTEETSCN